MRVDNNQLNMLVAAPYITYDKIKNRAPRIISEIRKPEVCAPREQIRPRISGELLVLVGAERRWSPRRVMIRGGQLLLGGIQGESCSGIRIPLRQLSLRAGPLPNSLSLIKGQSILLTLQTVNERSFDLWVKTVAIELIRQTPLEAVKYLDILNITENNEKKNRDCNSNYLPEKVITPPPLPVTDKPCDTCKPQVITFAPCDLNKNHWKENKNVKSTVEVLLKKCQTSENYVPVKEKLVLFESLCRIGRVHSTEDVSIRVNVGTKRARSMHDLTYCFSTGGVREICKYFETKLDDDTSNDYAVRKPKRFINSDSNLNKLKITFNRKIEGVSYA